MRTQETTPVLDRAPREPIRSEEDLVRALRSIAASYPAELRRGSRFVLKDLELYVQRVVFDLGLLRRRLESGTVIDLGGGYGLFGIGASLLGFRSIVVDDFYAPDRMTSESALTDLMEQHGVEPVRADLLGGELPFSPGSIDAVGMFHTFEHFHHSPRPLLQQVVTMLRPGGTFILGGPNCVNLRKRLTVPLGHGRWTAFEEWYDEPVFRGHVREPDVKDLRRVAEDMGLVDVEIAGANFLGMFTLGRLAKLVDRPLRLRPSFCSDIYVIASKPHDR